MDHKYYRFDDEHEEEVHTAIPLLLNATRRTASSAEAAAAANDNENDTAIIWITRNDNDDETEDYERESCCNMKRVLSWILLTMAFTASITMMAWNKMAMPTQAHAMNGNVHLSPVMAARGEGEGPFDFAFTASSYSSASPLGLSEGHSLLRGGKTTTIIIVGGGSAAEEEDVDRNMNSMPMSMSSEESMMMAFASIMMADLMREMEAMTFDDFFAGSLSGFEPKSCEHSRSYASALPAPVSVVPVP